LLKQVAILDNLRGHKGIVPLLDYGVMYGRCSGAVSARQQQQQPQWVLVFPRYSGSLRAWRRQRGAGLQRHDIALYLRVFLQVGSMRAQLNTRTGWVMEMVCVAVVGACWLQCSIMQAGLPWGLRQC
jgi:hypothetical protein